MKFYTSLPQQFINKEFLDPQLGEDYDKQYFTRNIVGKLPVKRRNLDSEFQHTKSRYDYYKPMDMCNTDDIYDWIKQINFGWADLVVMSDYCKGIFGHKNSNRIASFDKIVEHVIVNSKLCIVDTKNPNLDIYTGSDYIKLNNAELEAVKECYGEQNLEEHVAPHKLIVTCGREDTRLLYCDNDKETNEIKTFDIRKNPLRIETSSILDTVGSGDAFVAGFAWGLLEHEGGAVSAIAEGHSMAFRSLTRLGAQW